MSTQIKMVLGSDEMEEKEATLSKETHPESQKLAVPSYPYMFKQFAIQLVCDAISTKHALNNDWSLEKVVEILRSLNSANDMVMDAESSNAPQQERAAVEREDDFNDGYFTL